MWSGDSGLKDFEIREGDRLRPHNHDVIDFGSDHGVAGRQLSTSEGRNTQVTRVRYLASPASGVWDYSVHGFEASLGRAGMQRTRNLPFHAMVLGAKVLAKSAFVGNVQRRPGRAYFAPLMGLAEFRLVPFGYFYETIVYAYDCWPSAYDRWESFFRRHRVRLAMFSARTSAEHFQGLAGLETAWMPEAVDPTAYDPGPPLVHRKVDVLELGRRDPTFHRVVTPSLESAGRSHLYESEPGRIIFPTRAALIRGLANSRISVCFPSSVTHPGRSGNVETVTHRYFESMAAGCLVLGQCPGELRDLFGYDPLIALDRDRPASQLAEVLENIGDYQGMITRNRQRLLEVGTWDVRVHQIVDLLRARGYDL